VESARSGLPVEAINGMDQYVAEPAEDE